MFCVYIQTNNVIRIVWLCAYDDVTGKYAVLDRMSEISVEFVTVLLDFIYIIDMTHMHSAHTQMLRHRHTHYTLHIRNCEICYCVVVGLCVSVLVLFLSSPLSTEIQHIIAKSTTELECLVHVLGNFNFKHMFTLLHLHTHSFSSFACACVHSAIMVKI